MRANAPARAILGVRRGLAHSGAWRLGRYIYIYIYYYPNLLTRGAKLLSDAVALCWRLSAQVLSALDAAIDSLQTTCGTTGDASGSGNPSGGHWHGCRLLVLHFRYDSVVRLRVRLKIMRNL